MRLVNKKKALDLVEKGALLVDMRSPVDFRDGTIKGAINLPLKNFVNRLTGTRDKKTKIVIFGKEINDQELKSAVGYAETLGFENVFVSEYKQLIAEDKI